MNPPSAGLNSKAEYQVDSPDVPVPGHVLRSLGSPNIDRAHAAEALLVG